MIPTTRSARSWSVLYPSSPSELTAWEVARYYACLAQVDRPGARTLGQPRRTCSYDHPKRADAIRDDFSPGGTHERIVSASCDARAHIPHALPAANKLGNGRARIG